MQYRCERCGSDDVCQKVGYCVTAIACNQCGHKDMEFDDDFDGGSGFEEQEDDEEDFLG